MRLSLSVWEWVDCSYGGPLLVWSGWHDYARVGLAWIWGGLYHLTVVATPLPLLRASPPPPTLSLSHTHTLAQGPSQCTGLMSRARCSVVLNGDPVDEEDDDNDEDDDVDDGGYGAKEGESEDAGKTAAARRQRRLLRLDRYAAKCANCGRTARVHGDPFTARSLYHSFQELEGSAEVPVRGSLPLPWRFETPYVMATFVP